MEKKKTGKLTNLIIKLTKAAREKKSLKTDDFKKFSSETGEKWEENFSKVIQAQIIPR